MDKLVTRVAWNSILSEREKAQVRRVVTHTRTFAANSEIVPAGVPIDFSSVILSGLSCRHKFLNSGARQITAFQIAGDFCDLHSYMVKTMEECVFAITDCEVGIVPHKELDRIVEQAPNLARQLWLYTLIDASVYREWIVSIGRRPVHSRLAHLICEMYLRLKTVGLVDGMSYPLPVTQQDISDAMGTSLVHTNRTLARLRREGLATFANRAVTIRNWAELQRVAEFDPTYLHLHRTAKA